MRFIFFISRSQNYLFIRLTLIMLNRHLILSNVFFVSQYLTQFCDFLNIPDAMIVRTYIHTYAYVCAIMCKSKKIQKFKKKKNYEILILFLIKQLIWIMDEWTSVWYNLFSVIGWFKSVCEWSLKAKKTKSRMLLVKFYFAYAHIMSEHIFIIYTS